jgi:rhamnosyltransferase
MNIICSIVIRSFNEQKHIGQLLEGIKHQTIYNSLEIILVDSGSTDDTVAIANSYGVKVVHINPDEFSFGRALNKGCETAKGEFLLFASAHVYPLYTNWVEKMLAPFTDNKIALIYGRQVGNDLTKYSEHQLFKKWFPNRSNYDQTIAFCNNANAAVRKDLWVNQPYNEQITGLEDLDWASKIQSKGYKIAYEADAPIVHVHEETPTRIKNRYRREAIALKVIFPTEQFSFLSFVRLSISNICSDSFHAIYERKFLSNLSSIVMFRLMQFWGTYLGYKQDKQLNKTLIKRLYYPNDLKTAAHKKKDAGTPPRIGKKIIYNSVEN